MSKRKQIKEKLKRQYRLVILNEKTFEERASMKLTRLNVLIAVSSTLVILVFLIVSIISFTPLREYIPGYADVALRRDLNNVYLRVDSLEKALTAREKYLQIVRNVIEGKSSDINIGNTNDNSKNQEPYDKEIMDKKSKEDSLLRLEMEAQNLDVKAGFANESNILNRLNFFKPIDGVITGKFEPTKQHYAIDIASDENEPVKAVLDGTVIASTYTIETGNVIAIQHSNNLVSFYKHNSSLLKKVGNFVKAGDAVAIVGNSGLHSSGTHLHLELWYNGIPVNPVDFINFN